MKVIRTVKDMQKTILEHRNDTIGFVPTMGFLHEGHTSLVRQAKLENNLIVMSIFVNPLQFGPNEDFEEYPRDEAKDIETAKENGVDILFLPTVEEMYPEAMAINLTVIKGTDVLCGRSRPGHFDGVGMVLTKLFHIVQPTNVYFGLKDAQQYAVVYTLVQQLNFPLKVIGLPTVRELDGLAKSSRNVYLSKKERNEATTIFKSLQHAQKLIVDGLKNPVTIISEVKSLLQKETNGIIDYVDILSYPTLEEVITVDKQIIIAVAVQFKQARLIDNILLQPDGTRIDRIQ